jgi:hypothetical protein
MSTMLKIIEAFLSQKLEWRVLEASMLLLKIN